MSCSPFDLKDYFFGELGNDERRAVDQHIAACTACREELNTLGFTRSALLSVPEEEPPRRIAFVSDKVFELRWWQKLWTSAPQLGFASACVLALAIGFHAMYKPAGASPPTVIAQVDQAQIEAEVARRLDAAVRKVVAEAQEQQAAKVLDAVNARLKQARREHQADLLAFADYVERVRKENLLVRKASYEREAPGVTQ
jgi:anti-sigma factor RsiW